MVHKHGQKQKYSANDGYTRVETKDTIRLLAGQEASKLKGRLVGLFGRLLGCLWLRLLLDWEGGVKVSVKKARNGNGGSHTHNGREDEHKLGSD